VWEDKPEDVVEQCARELPVLEEVSERAIEDPSGEPTNLIIEGDNYHALSVLNYTHAGTLLLAGHGLGVLVPGLGKGGKCQGKVLLGGEG
jgi:hypothetical protein